jgi:hypothetical protein
MKRFLVFTAMLCLFAGSAMAAETLIFMGIADDRVAIIENIGTVGFE